MRSQVVNTPLRWAPYVLVCLLCVCTFLELTHAQGVLEEEVVGVSQGGGGLATPVFFSSEVRDGDIVSYDAVKGEYARTQVAYDSRAYGVVVVDPVLYATEVTEREGLLPVVRFGNTIVNVSSIGGEIRAGDLVTSSRILGLGQRADENISGYVLGVAISDVQYEPSAIQVGDEVVRLGRVSVALSMGYHQGRGEDEQESDLSIGVGTSTLASVLPDSDSVVTTTAKGFDVVEMTKYVLGALVALLALGIALRYFGGFFKESIVAVGRNPLSHGQVRSILIWNTLMIILIGGAGLLIGVVIILV